MKTLKTEIPFPSVCHCVASAWLASVIIGLSGLLAGNISAQTDTITPMAPHAWYRADLGLSTNGSNEITSWATQTATSAALANVIGTPVARTFKRTGGGNATVVQLDGGAALWNTVGNFGTLSGNRTVVVRARLNGSNDGFLFDGSTGSGQTRAQIRSNTWQVGVQATNFDFTDPDPDTGAITAELWQTHIFQYEESGGNTQVTHWIDGTQVGTHSVAVDTTLGGFILGSNGAGSMNLAVDVAEVIVFDRLLTAGERSSAETWLDERWGDLASPTVRFFSTILRDEGDNGSASYRIPGLVTTNAGTLVAVFDARWTGSGDLPANISLGIRRSTDGGYTWGPMILIADFDENEPGSQGNGIGDASILVDRSNGRIWCAALWSFGNNGWNGSGPGLAKEDTGQFMVNYSDDDGLTWTAPVSITSAIKDPAWNLYFNGPGKGICTRDGTLVFPAQYRDAGGTPRSNFIYSIDNGANWVTAPPAIASGNPETTESQIVELDNGDLLITMRNHQGINQRLWCIYSWDHNTETIADGSWGTPWFEETDPTVMASVERYRSVTDGHPWSGLLFSNPESNSREKMTIRLSLDQGQTWPYKRKINDRPAAYSCMTILPDGDIGIFYETSVSPSTSSTQNMTFARFSLSWLVGDTDTDGDGILDFEEDVLGMNKNDANDATLDSDGDGQSNFKEYIALTDINDSQSYFRIENMAINGGATELTVKSQLGRKYELQTSTTLQSGSWTTVGSAKFGTGGLLQFDLPASDPVDTRRFVRVHVSMP